MTLRGLGLLVSRLADAIKAHDHERIDKALSRLQAALTREVSPTTHRTARGELYCDFCGKTQREVKKLIAGPTAYICDDCGGLVRDILLEDDVINAPPPRDPDDPAIVACRVRTLRAMADLYTASAKRCGEDAAALEEGRRPSLAVDALTRAIRTGEEST